MPHRIGRYDVVNRIGQGGMGSLYLARDPVLDRPLAIKVLSSDDPELRQRFAREARSAASLKHPNIVTLYDVGTDQGRPFIAMEYIDGETMGEAIRRQAPLPLSRKLQLLIELCDGLGYAHRRGIIHRDIKPANLMITADGVLKILDFGIARVATSEVATGLTRTGMMVGTVHYMSPEQIEGTRVDQRSDIFAVGLVSYELIGGRKAYGGATHEVLYKIMHREPQPLAEICPGLDPDLYVGITRAISKNPDDRYQTLEIFGDDLRRIRGRLDESSEATTFIEPRPARAETPTNRSDSGAPVATPAPTPRVQDTGRRRQLQLEEHLRQAQQHFASGAFEAAIEQCEHAILLDPKDSRALDLLQQSHVATDDRYAAQRVSEAAAALTAGRIDEAEALLAQALEVRPESTDALALQQRIQELREQQHRPLEPPTSVEPPKPATVAPLPPVAVKTRPPLARIGAMAAGLLTVALAGMWWLGWFSSTPPDQGSRPDSAQTPRDTVGREAASAGNTGGPAAATPTVTPAETGRPSRAASEPAAPIDELMRRAEAARRTGDGAQAIEWAMLVQARDRNHAGARALLAEVVKEASGTAAAARAAAIKANAGSTAAFQRADARVSEGRTTTDPRKQFAAFSDATTLFRDAERAAPTTPTPTPPEAAPPPSPPPADPTIRARALLDDAEAALKRGSLDEAEKRLLEIDAELKARNASLSSADDARRTVVANGIRNGRSEATRRADVAAIRGTLNAYKEAYERLDVDRLLVVAPFLRDRRSQLEASFKQMSSQTLEMTIGEPDINGARATISVRAVLTQVPRVGRRLPPNSREGLFVLVKNASGPWVIEAIK